MAQQLDKMIDEADLLYVKESILAAMKPAIGFALDQVDEHLFQSRSRFGGSPELPVDFVWPSNEERPLNNLMQVDLFEISVFHSGLAFPYSGQLAFLYDFQEQPWGYVPENLNGFSVRFIPESTHTASTDSPDSVIELHRCEVFYFELQTLPHSGSRDAELLERENDMSEKEIDRYYDLVEEFEARAFPGREPANHHLSGHAANVQGDMQLEAQLVMNGLYCGDPSGYQDPRVAELECGTDDWILLLQLDTDDLLGMMWGDGGTLFYWIRRNDLTVQNFENVWMTMQCR